jgi:hypothetical protein
MRAYLGIGDAPAVEASAIKGEGVAQTLRAAVSLMLDNVKGNVDITLYEAPDLKKPDLSVKSGVTSMSAGTPKVGVQSASGASSVSVPPKPKMEPVPVIPASTPPASQFEPEVSPFDDDTPFGEVEAESVDAMQAEADPFVTEVPVEHAVEQAPFGSSEEVVAPPAADLPTDHDGLHEALVGARTIVRQLEEALKAARDHERSIAEKLGE